MTLEQLHYPIFTKVVIYITNKRVIRFVYKTCELYI